jgi:PKHD-type hydroxylase
MLICIDNVLSANEAAEFRRQIEGADWEDGAKSAGAIARLSKHNRQLSESLPLAITLRNEILRRLGNHPQFISAALPGKIYPPRFNRYDVGNTYGTHVDGAVMRIPGTNIALRSDLSATIFLSDPDSYDGGELEIDGASGTQSIKLEAGHMVLYDSSSLHRVTPVTRGTRYASFLWVESMVHESSGRTALYDLDQAIQRLTTTLGGKDVSVLQLSNVYHNLLRYWAQT